MRHDNRGGRALAWSSLALGAVLAFAAVLGRAGLAELEPDTWWWMALGALGASMASVALHLDIARRMILSDDAGFSLEHRRSDRILWRDITEVELRSASMVVRDAAGRAWTVDTTLDDVHAVVNRAFAAAMSHARAGARQTSFAASSYELCIVGGVFGVVWVGESVLMAAMHQFFTALHVGFTGVILAAIGTIYATAPLRVRVVEGRVDVVSRFRVRSTRLEKVRCGLRPHPHGRLALALLDEDGRITDLPPVGAASSALAAALCREAAISIDDFGLLVPEPKGMTRALVIVAAAYVVVPLTFTLAGAWLLAPTDASDSLLRARAALAFDHPARAREEALRFVEAHPLDREAHRLVVHAHLRDPRRHGSRHASTTDTVVLRRYEPMTASDDPEARLIGDQALAAFARDAGDLDTAATTLERSRAIDPMDASLRVELAEVRFAQGHGDQARTLVTGIGDCDAGALRFRMAMRGGDLDEMRETARCVTPRVELFAGARTGHLDLVGEGLRRAAAAVAASSIFAVLAALAVVRRLGVPRPLGLASFGALVGGVHAAITGAWDVMPGETERAIARALVCASWLAIACWLIAPRLCRGASPHARVRELFVIGVAATVPIVALSGFRGGVASPALPDVLLLVSLPVLVAGPSIVWVARRERQNRLASALVTALSVLVLHLVALLPPSAYVPSNLVAMCELGVVVLVMNELDVVGVRDPLPFEPPPFREVWLATFGVACARTLVAATTLPFDLVAPSLVTFVLGTSVLGWLIARLAPVVVSPADESRGTPLLHPRASRVC